MGFLDAFKNIWTSGWTWKNVENSFKDAANNFTGAGKSFIAGLYNYAVGGLTLDPDQRNQGLQDYLNFGKQFLGGVGSVVGGVTQVPVLNQTFQTLDQFQNETIRRPIGTAELVSGRKDQNAFNLDTWRQAYNDTRTVSAGQAAYWAIHNTTLGLSPVPDPTSPQGQEFFHKDNTAKWFSGTSDALVSIFADPTIVGGKLAKAGKLRYLSKVMDAAAVNSGKGAKFLDSSQADRLFNFYRHASNADITQQTVFNGVPSGGIANKVLFDAAKAEDPGEARQLFNDSLLHMWGDPKAQYRLAESAPRLAGALGAMGNGGRFSDVAQEAGTGNAAVDAIVNARRETASQAFLDDVANSRGLYGKATGVLADQPAPRLTVTSQWRVGMHQFANGGAATIFAKPVQRLVRPLTPTSTFTRLINFEDPGPTAVERIRSNWEGARVLPPEDLAKFVQDYATATTSDARFAAFSNGENAIFKAIADKYGFTPTEAEQAVARINSMRATSRAAFSQSRRYMANDARKLAQALWDANRFDDSARARQLADDADQAMRRGEQPTSHVAMPDDQGNQIYIPEKFDVSGSPLMPVQHADIAAAMDWRLLHQALWWEKKGPIGQKAYVAIDNARDVLDRVSSVWKVAQLLRIGYGWRMLSDENSRALAVIGAGRTFSAMTNGIANLGQNLYNRYGRHVVEDFNARRAARGDNLYDTVDAADEETGVAHTDLAEAHPDEPPVEINPKTKRPYGKRSARVRQVYRSYGKAVADGVLSPTDYVDAALTAYDKAPNKVPSEMAQIIADHVQALTDPSRDLLEHALWQQGRDMAFRPTWQRGFLDDLTERRMSVVDPFSGLAPDKMPRVTGLSQVKRLNPQDEMQGLEEYVHNHADELLKPTSLLHAQVMKDGFIELGVAKTDVPDVIKPTGGRRIKLKNGKVADYLQAGAGGLKINTPNGPLTIDHAFDGAEGARLQQQVSSTGEGMSWADRITDKTYNEMMQKTRDIWRDVLPNEQHYGPSWQRVVNVQLGNDPVARQILAGASDEDIVNWIRKTPEGRAYLERLGPWQSKYWAQVQSVRAMVDLYVPDVGDLRQKVLKREADFEDLKAAVPDVMDMPAVHGTAIEAAVPGRFSKLVNGFVNKTFRAIGDIPADRMARFPFASERYQLHAQKLYDTYLEQHYKAGYDSIPADVLGRIQDQARQRAAADVKKYLFDATTSHDLARFARLVVPFGSAASDSFNKWGVISKERPWVPYNLWKAWNAPERGGYTTDENGNHRKWVNGVPRWVSYDPTTKQEIVLPENYTPKNTYVSLQLASDLLPKALAGEVDGVRLTPSVNKETFNTFLGLPTAGPLVSVPTNAFALRNPEFADNKLVRKFILPFGPQTDSKALFVPGYLQTLIGMTKRQDGDLASTQALTIYQTEMIRYGMGERPKPPTFAEARSKAADLRGLRFAYQFSGLTPQFKSPYQPYLDYYRQLRAQDPATADAKFYQTAGPEYFMLTASVTRNLAGIPATLQSYKAQQHYRDLMDKYPDIASLIVGAEGAGAFSQAVYEYQLNQALSPGSDKKQRERLSLQDSIEDVAIREGWLRWNKLQSAIHADLAERGLTSITQHGAEDLRAAQAKFIRNSMYWNQSPTGGKQLNPWYVDYSTTDRSRTQGRLLAMSQIINDPRLRQRDDIRGLADYLANRKEMAGLMKANGYATLNSNKAAGLRTMWNNYVFQLKGDNGAFADLYDRWLTGDKYLDSQI